MTSNLTSNLTRALTSALTRAREHYNSNPINFLKQTTMKKLVIVLALAMMSAAVSAKVVKEGKTYRSVSTRTATQRDSIATGYDYETRNGVWPIYLDKANGHAYTCRTSKNGKWYRQQLGEEISRDLCREYGITYVPAKARKSGDDSSNRAKK